MEVIGSIISIEQSLSYRPQRVTQPKNEELILNLLIL